MMAAGEGKTMLSIEAEEFQRLQTQLIELRTANYQLKEQHAKATAELSQLNEKLQAQARDLEKANKAIQRSKKAKELQTLVEENDNLQRKLESQEGEFRLQSRTLMDELAKVCGENDNLKSEISELKAAPGGGGGGGGDVTHLQAENAALQKSLQVLQEKLQECTASVSGEGGAGQNDSSSDARVLELEVRLRTEEEEKQLLRNKLEEMQESARREQAELRGELEKWTEKAKKKQDSFLQLQEEKEKHFHESRAAFDEMVRSKDHELQLLQDQVQSLKENLATRTEANAASDEVARQMAQLSNEKEELRLKCSCLTEERDGLVSKRGKLESLTEELGRELHQSKANLGEERKRCIDLQTQLDEAKLSQEQLADQVVSMNEEKFNLMKELETVQKLAEKRKALLDELSIKAQESASERRREMDDLQEKHQEELERVEEDLRQEKTRVHELLEVSGEVSELRRQVASLEEERKSAVARVAELESTLEQSKEEHETALVGLQEECEKKVKSLQSELEGCHEEVESKDARMSELEREVEDKEQQIKIVEKKSNGMLKDLKRQLQQMQKREDKLHEQMSELRGSQGMEQMFSPASLNRDNSHESVNSQHSRDSSLSSLRGLANDGSPGAVGSIPSPTNSLTAQLGAPQSLPEETRELVAKVAELQQEKWLLEEKVHHLESSGSALVADVMQKSEIIKSYFMETKADHSPSQRRSMADRMSPMRLVRAKTKEETLGEINRKMQRALEEALMKNIHLQKNIEMLTAELEKHSNIPLPSPDTDNQSQADTSGASGCGP